jgi:hypothetical protein
MSTLASVTIRDIYSNLPTAGIPGRLFFVSSGANAGNGYYDDGSAWHLISTSGGGGGGGTIIGTANFSMATGAITNAHYGGCISSVTFTSNGHFTVNLSPSQVNFSIAFAASDATSNGVSIYLNQAASPNFNASTSSISVFVLDGVLSAFINPSQVTVMIAQM